MFQQGPYQVLGQNHHHHHAPSRLLSSVPECQCTYTSPSTVRKDGEREMVSSIPIIAFHHLIKLGLGV